MSPAVEADPNHWTAKPFLSIQAYYSSPTAFGEGTQEPLWHFKGHPPFSLVLQKKVLGVVEGVVVCLHWNLLDGKRATVGPSALPYLEAAYAAQSAEQGNKTAGGAGDPRGAVLLEPSWGAEL